jgi:hypothetical protein
VAHKAYSGLRLINRQVRQLAAREIKMAPVFAPEPFFLRRVFQHSQNGRREGMRKVMGTSKLILYRFIDLKSLIELAACGAGTSDRRD